MGGWLIVDIAILVLVLLLNIALLVVRVAKVVSMRREERAARTGSPTDSDTEPDTEPDPEPDTSWLQSDLHVDEDDWELWDVWWRRIGDVFEVKYTVENYRPGETVYHGDMVLMFQRGVSLDTDDVPVTAVMLKGACARFFQSFTAADDSEPLIRLNRASTPISVRP